MSIKEIEQPYLLMVGDTSHPGYAKTAIGLKDWAPEACLAQLRLSPSATDLGLPEMTVAQAAAAGARTLVIGIAPAGGRLPEEWHPLLIEALEAGLDLAAGLHHRLRDIPGIAALAGQHGRMIHDVRHSDGHFDVGTGKKRPGKRLLTVGTDCALGKKYTALAIARSLRARGVDADFRATGQTGILISGGGVAVDAVTADFIAGAAEALSPANDDGHWDIIEGQGSLFHPAFAGVSLGLLHGSQPDALVLCHDPTRTAVMGFPHIPIMPLAQAMAAYVEAARLTNASARCAGLSLNTSSLSASAAEALLNQTAEEFNLPCIDPLRTGAEAIVDELLSSALDGRAHG